MKKNLSEEEGSVSELLHDLQFLPARVLFLLRGMRPFFVTSLFEKAALFNTTSEQFGHVVLFCFFAFVCLLVVVLFFVFLMPLGWENLQEHLGDPPTVHANW